MLSDGQGALFPESDSGDDKPAILFRGLGEVHARLLKFYGPPPSREVWDPLTQMIYSLCSSRTKDPESMATIQALRVRYDGWPSGPNSWDEVRWERMRDAPVQEIEETLRLVTFPEKKAPQLKAALQKITERTGVLSLAFLARYRTEKIRAWIELLPGAGAKTSAAVVNFSSLRRPALAIDAHHQRIAIRLGVVGEKATPRQVEQALTPLMPSDWTPVIMDDHHTLMKRLGQEICQAKITLCPRCPLREICGTGLKSTAA